MENGFSARRNHAFPAGLRVLVVDDDPTWLKILEKMLKKCSYEVTTCCLAMEALNLLRERKDRYDIVISDVNMPDMDGFKLLEHVGLEMDLPVVMMSVDGETSRVMRGVQHGACDYLLKPIRLKELRNIWQHVFRKRMRETRYMNNLVVTPMTGSASDQYDLHFLRGDNLTSLKKRKDINEHDDKDFADSSPVKRARVVWSVDLHQKFVDAVNQIGFDKVGPKKILDLMNVPWLTRENVASHLQKYRLYLTRLHKENDLHTTCTEQKHSDSSLKDADWNISLHESVNLYQNDAAKDTYNCSDNLFLQNIGPKSNGSDPEGLVSEPAGSATGSAPISKNEENLQLEFNQTFASPESEENFEALNPNMQEHYSWTGDTEIQFRQEHKPLANLGSGFTHLQLPCAPYDIQADQLQSIPSFSSRSSIKDNDAFFPVENKVGEYTYNLNPTRSTMDPFQIQTTAYNSTFEILAATMSMKDQDFDPICTANLGCRLPFAFMDDDFHISCYEADSYIRNSGHEKIDLPSDSDPVISNNLYDALRNACEYSYDPGEYHAIDQGLFIA